MTDWDLLSSYAGLLTLAVGSIYAGAFGSLERKREDQSDEDAEVLERMSSEDAWLFPIMGSAVLVGLYAIVKYFGKEWINWLLGLYFSLSGVGSVWKSLVCLSRLAVGNARWKQFSKYQILVRKAQQELFSISWRTPTLFLFPLGATPSILYTFSTASRKSVLLTDVLSLSFSHNALSLLRIDSFKTGCILLSGLFVYDIWWVFGTDVMINVATTLDIPIKLLWPKSMTFSGARGFTMLGLGDVVIPGTFIALALRYDYHRYSKSAPKAAFVKPYFYSALVSYIVGLGTTMAVMHTFHTAQPALLYLSPACILSFFITALVRGELKAAWEWSDTPEKSTPGKDGEGPLKTNSDNVAMAAGPDGDACKSEAVTDGSTTSKMQGDI